MLFVFCRGLTLFVSAAEFYLSDLGKNSVQLSIDTHKKTVIDNLAGGIAFEDADLELTEYTDSIFIKYNHKKINATDREYLIERIVIDRKTGSFNGERYDSYRGLDQSVFPNGALVYTMSGACKPLKRYF